MVTSKKTRGSRGRNSSRQSRCPGWSTMTALADRPLRPRLASGPARSSWSHHADRRRRSLPGSSQWRTPTMAVDRFELIFSYDQYQQAVLSSGLQ